MNIFVFGSNREGRHGKGAALEARRNHGAIYGQSSGLQGASYAIVTKELRTTLPPVTLEQIGVSVSHFLNFTEAHPEHTFYVTEIGCGLAGFAKEQIAPLFHNAPDNVKLPPGWRGGVEGGEMIYAKEEER